MQLLLNSSAQHQQWHDNRMILPLPRVNSHNHGESNAVSPHGYYSHYNHPPGWYPPPTLTQMSSAPPSNLSAQQGRPLHNFSILASPLGQQEQPLHNYGPPRNSLGQEERSLHNYGISMNPPGPHERSNYCYGFPGNPLNQQERPLHNYGPPGHSISQQERSNQSYGPPISSSCQERPIHNLGPPGKPATQQEQSVYSYEPPGDLVSPKNRQMDSYISSEDLTSSHAHPATPSNGTYLAPPTPTKEYQYPNGK